MLNSGPYARAKHSTQSGTFVHFLNKLAPFFYQLTIYSWALRAASFKLLMKKSDSPTSCAFAAVYPHCEQTFEEGLSTNRIVHFRLPYTFRGSTLSEFFLSCLYQVFVDRLFVFVSLLKQKWQKGVIRNYTTEKRDFGSKLEHVYLLCDCRWGPTACQSLTFLQDSSALSMLTKTYTRCSPVM